MTPRARPWRALAAVALAGVALAASAAEVTLNTAWMRPAAAGAPAARAYVDIESPVALELVGASSPVATQVLLVHVRRLDDPGSEEVVPSMRIAEGAVTRLAFRGDHLRLVDVQQDLANGTPVPLTLVFRDPQGGEIRSSTQITVRGLLLPQHSGSDAAMPAAGAELPGTERR